MKSQAKLYGPIHKGLVLIAYASSEGLNEAVYSHSLARAFPALTEKRNIIQASGQLCGHMHDIKVLIFSLKKLYR